MTKDKRLCSTAAADCQTASKRLSDLSEEAAWSKRENEGGAVKMDESGIGEDTTWRHSTEWAKLLSPATKNDGKMKGKRREHRGRNDGAPSRSLTSS